MADLMTLDDMADSKLDLNTLKVFANGDENTVNYPRLRPDLDVGSIAELRKKIMQNGFVGATPFTKKADMVASSLADGSYAIVTNDAVDVTGIYLKTAGVWSQISYNMANILHNQLLPYFDFTPGKNLYNKATKQIGNYVNASGVIKTAANWAMSDYIAVTPNQQYTVSSTARRTGLAFYDTNKAYIANTYVDSTTVAGPTTVTAPSNAAYLIINVDSDSVTGTNVQVEKGAAATAYADYVATAAYKPALMPATLADKAYVDSKTAKSYEISIASKNLFDASKVVADSYIKNTGAISAAAGWGRSGMIPVTPNQQYTLSGTRGREGLAFYASATDTTAISYLATTTLPAAVTVPSNANFVAFNLYSSSSPNYSNVQFEQGVTATAYQAYGNKLMIDPSLIYSDKVIKNKLKIDNGNAYLTAISDINLVLQMSLTKTNTHSNSIVFNFENDYVDGVLVRNLGDDVAPMRIDNTTVGANHGYNKTDITTSAAHGKTNADVGSVWADGTKEYVIVDVPSTTVVSVTSRTDNTAFSGSSLTHVSGATNTASITVSSLVSNQWYQVIRDRQLNVFVDDVLIDTAVNKEYEYKGTVRFAESYSIMKKTDIVEWLIANKGQNPSIYLADKAYTVAFIYEFDIEGGCVIYFSGVGRKSIALQDQMITQSVKLAGGNGTVYYYVPKTKAFTTGGYSYNFALKEAIESKNPSTPIYFDAAKVDVGQAVNRLVQLNDKVGYATGYLPILDAELSKRLVNASNKFLEIRNSSLKVYPRLIDTAIKTTIEPNDVFSAIAYRKYFKKQTNRTSKYVVRSSQGKYLYLDWHNTALTDEVNLPNDLQGKVYTVIEKSDNVTVLNQFVGDKLLVNVNASGGYAFLVVRF